MYRCYDLLTRSLAVLRSQQHRFMALDLVLSGRILVASMLSQLSETVYLPKLFLLAIFSVSMHALPQHISEARCSPQSL